MAGGDVKDGDRTASSTDGWVGAVAVVIVAAAVLVGAALLTPGRPDCVAYTAAGHVFCPWYRAFLRNAMLLLGVLVGMVVVVGYPLGLLRELLGGRG